MKTTEYPLDEIDILKLENIVLQQKLAHVEIERLRTAYDLHIMRICSVLGVEAGHNNVLVRNNILIVMGEEEREENGSSSDG